MAIPNMLNDFVRQLRGRKFFGKTGKHVAEIELGVRYNDLMRVENGGTISLSAAWLTLFKEKYELSSWDCSLIEKLNELSRASRLGRTTAEIDPSDFLGGRSILFMNHQAAGPLLDSHRSFQRIIVKASSFRAAFERGQFGSEDETVRFIDSLFDSSAEVRVITEEPPDMRSAFCPFLVVESMMVSFRVSPTYWFSTCNEDDLSLCRGIFEKCWNEALEKGGAQRALLRRLKPRENRDPSPTTRKITPEVLAFLRYAQDQHPEFSAFTQRQIHQALYIFSNGAIGLSPGEEHDPAPLRFIEQFLTRQQPPVVKDGPPLPGVVKRSPVRPAPFRLRASRLSDLDSKRAHEPRD